MKLYYFYLDCYYTANTVYMGIIELVKEWVGDGLEGGRAIGGGGSVAILEYISWVKRSNPGKIIEL
jgi:hypothetical protein